MRLPPDALGRRIPSALHAELGRLVVRYLGVDEKAVARLAAGSGVPA